MNAYESIKLGENRGKPRLWLQGMKAAKAGFLPGMRFTIHKHDDKNMLVLELNQFGERIVSRKLKGETEIPIIDINSSEVLSVFEGFNAVRIIVKGMRIIILPMAVEIAKKERMARLKSKLEKGEPLTVGSLSHGGGVLSHAIHTGMADAGLKTRLSFANEIRPELLEQAHDFNDAWDSNTIPLAAPMQELAFDAWAMNHLPKVEVIEAGIPCSGASVSGRAKNGAGHAEAHPEVGHLIVPFLAIIAKVQPLCVVLENVKQWQNTASMCIFRNTLRDFGYTVHETVLKGSEWNELENRERLCVLAVSEGLDLDFANLHKPDPIVRKIGEILDPIKDDDESWDEMAYLKRKQQSDIEKGSNFMMQIVTSESTSCPTLTKGFAKRRSTDPKLAHPTNPDLLRQFTPGEHARLKGAPEKLVEGLGVTIAHEILGQSVCYGPFRAVGRLVAETLISGRLASDTIERIAKASQRDLLQEVQSGELSEA